MRPTADVIGALTAAGRSVVGPAKSLLRSRSHIGDASATEMTDRGGELCGERYRHEGGQPFRDHEETAETYVRVLPSEL